MVSLFPHPAPFRVHLTMDTRAFGYILPTTGRIRDLHPLETCAARRTTKRPQRISPSRSDFVCLFCFIQDNEFCEKHAIGMCEMTTLSLKLLGGWLELTVIPRFLKNLLSIFFKKHLRVCVSSNF